MKNMKLLISLVLVVIVCVVMAGCGSHPSSGNEGWNDPNKPANQEWSDPENPDDQSWSDPDDYEDQDWDDPENYEDQDWRDPENPGTVTTDPDESEHTGNYRHEIDGIVFYTEHDVEQWIDRSGNDPVFHLEQMVADIFGSGTTSWDGTAMVPAFGAIASFEITNQSTDGGTSRLADNNHYPIINMGGCAIYDLGPATGDSEYYKPLYYFYDSNHTTEYEMIEISLYLCEKWVSDEYYYFEDFTSSSRFMVVNR